jgi:UPF0755 protein
MEQGRRTAPPVWQPPGEAPRRQPSRQGKAPPPPRKPKKRGNGRVFSNPWVYLLFVFGISVILAALCWTAANDVLSLNKPEHSAVIIIEEGDSYGSLVDQLAKNQIIEYKFVFRLFSTLAGGESKVTPGTYVLDTDMDYRAIISGLGANSDSRMTASVTIPEGYTLDHIFKTLEEKGVTTEEKLREMAASHNYAFSFLQEIPLGDYHRLEGYLFPDTYEFYMGEDPLYVLNKMLVNFDAKFTDALRNKIAGSKYNIRDTLILASMIEKETSGSDRGTISSVLHNRLEKPTSETAGFLNIDATIQYVLPEGQTVTAGDYSSVQSPYNTYLHKGLPPGPIANPGMESVLAALNPENSGYYYYALGTDGVHHFFKNNSEHQRFLAGGQ